MAPPKDAAAKRAPAGRGYDFDEPEASAELVQLASKLKAPGKGKDALVKLLKPLYAALEGLPQEVEMLGSAKESLPPLLLQHATAKQADKDVRLYGALCIVHVLRVYAPETPYDDEQLKATFQLVLDCCSRLGSSASGAFDLTRAMLQTFADIKLYYAMLDLDDERLPLRTFEVLLQAARPENLEALQGPATIVLGGLLEDLDPLPQPISDTVLTALAAPHDSPYTPASQKLAAQLLGGRDSTLRSRMVQQVLGYVQAEVDGDAAAAAPFDTFALLQGLHTAAPLLLLPVLSELKAKLQQSEEGPRLGAAALLTRLLAAPPTGVEAGGGGVTDTGPRPTGSLANGSALGVVTGGGATPLVLQSPELLEELLRRFEDRSPAVRLAMLGHTAQLVAAAATADVSGRLERQVLKVARQRLQDLDERVRASACRVLCAIAAGAAAGQPASTVVAAAAAAVAQGQRGKAGAKAALAAATAADAEAAAGAGPSGPPLFDDEVLTALQEVGRGRLQDIKPSVRRDAASGLLAAWRAGCGALAQGALSMHSLVQCLGWVPARLCLVAAQQPDVRADLMALLAKPSPAPSAQHSHGKQGGSKGGAAAGGGVGLVPSSLGQRQGADVWAALWASYNETEQAAVRLLVGFKAEAGRALAQLVATRRRAAEAAKAATGADGVQVTELRQRLDRRMVLCCRELARLLGGNDAAAARAFEQLRGLVAEAKDGFLWDKLEQLSQPHRSPETLAALRKDALSRLPSGGSKAPTADLITRISLLAQPTVLSPAHVSGLLAGLEASAAAANPAAATSPDTAHAAALVVATAKTAPELCAAAMPAVIRAVTTSPVGPELLVTTAVRVLRHAGSACPVAPEAGKVERGGEGGSQEEREGEEGGEKEDEEDDKENRGKKRGRSGKGNEGKEGPAAAKRSKQANGGQAAAGTDTAAQTRAALTQSLCDLCLGPYGKAAKSAVHALCAVLGRAEAPGVLRKLAARLAAALAPGREALAATAAAMRALGSVGVVAPEMFAGHAATFCNFVCRSYMHAALKPPPPGKGRKDRAPLADPAALAAHVDGSKDAALLAQTSPPVRLKAQAIRALVRGCTPDADDAPTQGAAAAAGLGPGEMRPVPAATAAVVVPELEELLAGMIDPDHDLEVYGAATEADKPHLRGCAASALLRLARRHDSRLSPRSFVALALAIQDPCVDVRQSFSRQVAEHMTWTLRQGSRSHLVAKYAAVLPLSAVDPRESNPEAAARRLRDAVARLRRKAQQDALQAAARVGAGPGGSASAGPDPAAAASLANQPEFLLAYLVYALAHHPDFPQMPESDEDEVPELDDYRPFQDMLQFALEPLLASPEPDDGPSAGGAVGGALPAVLKVLRFVRLRTEEGDEQAGPSSTANLRLMADMGTMVARAIVARELRASGALGPAGPGGKRAGPGGARSKQAAAGVVDEAAVAQAVERLAQRQHPGQVMMPKGMFRLLRGEEAQATKGLERDGSCIPEGYEVVLSPSVQLMGLNAAAKPGQAGAAGGGAGAGAGAARAQQPQRSGAGDAGSEGTAGASHGNGNGQDEDEEGAGEEDEEEEAGARAARRALTPRRGGKGVAAAGQGKGGAGGKRGGGGKAAAPATKRTRASPKNLSPKGPSPKAGKGKGKAPAKRKSGGYESLSEGEESELEESEDEEESEEEEEEEEQPLKRAAAGKPATAAAPGKKPAPGTAAAGAAAAAKTAAPQPQKQRVSEPEDAYDLPLDDEEEEEEQPKPAKRSAGAAKKASPAAKAAAASGKGRGKKTAPTAAAAAKPPPKPQQQQQQRRVSEVSDAYDLPVDDDEDQEEPPPKQPAKKAASKGAAQGAKPPAKAQPKASAHAPAAAAPRQAAAAGLKKRPQQEQPAAEAAGAMDASFGDGDGYDFGADGEEDVSEGAAPKPGKGAGTGKPSARAKAAAASPQRGKARAPTNGHAAVAAPAVAKVGARTAPASAGYDFDGSDQEADYYWVLSSTGDNGGWYRAALRDTALGPAELAAQLARLQPGEGAAGAEAAAPLLPATRLAALLDAACGCLQRLAGVPRPAAAAGASLGAQALCALLLTDVLRILRPLVRLSAADRSAAGAASVPCDALATALVPIFAVAVAAATSQPAGAPTASPALPPPHRLLLSALLAVVHALASAVPAAPQPQAQALSAASAHLYAPPVQLSHPSAAAVEEGGAAGLSSGGGAAGVPAAGAGGGGSDAGGLCELLLPLLRLLPRARRLFSPAAQHDVACCLALAAKARGPARRLLAAAADILLAAGAAAPGVAAGADRPELEVDRAWPAGPKAEEAPGKATQAEGQMSAALAAAATMEATQGTLTMAAGVAATEAMAEVGALLEVAFRRVLPCTEQVTQVVLLQLLAVLARDQPRLPRRFLPAQAAGLLEDALVLAALEAEPLEAAGNGGGGGGTVGSGGEGLQEAGGGGAGVGADELRDVQLALSRAWGDKSCVSSHRTRSCLVSVQPYGSILRLAEPFVDVSIPGEGSGGDGLPGCRDGYGDDGGGGVQRQSSGCDSCDGTLSMYLLPPGPTEASATYVAVPFEDIASAALDVPQCSGGASAYCRGSGSPTAKLQLALSRVPPGLTRLLEPLGHVAGGQPGVELPACGGQAEGGSGDVRVRDQLEGGAAIQQKGEGGDAGGGQEAEARGGASRNGGAAQAAVEESAPTGKVRTPLHALLPSRRPRPCGGAGTSRTPDTGLETTDDVILVEDDVNLKRPAKRRRAGGSCSAEGADTSGPLAADRRSRAAAVVWAVGHWAWVAAWVLATSRLLLGLAAEAGEEMGDAMDTSLDPCQLVSRLESLQQVDHEALHGADVDSAEQLELVRAVAERMQRLVTGADTEAATEEALLKYLLHLLPPELGPKTAAVCWEPVGELTLPEILSQVFEVLSGDTEQLHQEELTAVMQVCVTGDRKGPGQAKANVRLPPSPGNQQPGGTTKGPHARDKLGLIFIPPLLGFMAGKDARHARLDVRRGVSGTLLDLVTASKPNQRLVAEAGLRHLVDLAFGTFLPRAADYQCQLDLVEVLFRVGRKVAPQLPARYLKGAALEALKGALERASGADVDVGEELRPVVREVNTALGKAATVFTYRFLRLEVQGPPGVQPADCWLDVAVGAGGAGGGSGGGHVTVSLLIPEPDQDPEEPVLPEAVDINFGAFGSPPFPIRSVVIRHLPGTADFASAPAMQLEVDLLPTHLPKALQEAGDGDGGSGGRQGVRLVFTMGKEEARALLEHLPRVCEGGSGSAGLVVAGTIHGTGRRQGKDNEDEEMEEKEAGARSAGRAVTPRRGGNGVAAAGQGKGGAGGKRGGCGKAAAPAAKRARASPKNLSPKGPSPKAGKGKGKAAAKRKSGGYESLSEGEESELEESEDEGESEEEEEEEEQRPAKRTAAGKPAAAAVKGTKPAQSKAAAAAAAAAKTAAPQPQKRRVSEPEDAYDLPLADDGEEAAEEERVPTARAGKAKAPAKRKAGGYESLSEGEESELEESEDEEESEEEEEEQVPAAGTGKAKAPAKRKAGGYESLSEGEESELEESEDDEESEEEEEEEEEQAPKAGKGKGKAPAKRKAGGYESLSEGEESELGESGDEEESEEEEEEEQRPAKGAAAGKPAAAAAKGTKPALGKAAAAAAAAAETAVPQPQKQRVSEPEDAYDLPLDDEEEEEEQPKPVKRSAGAAKKASPAAKAAAASGKGRGKKTAPAAADDDEEDEEPVPKQPAKKAAGKGAAQGAKPPAKAQPKASARVALLEDNELQEEPEEPVLPEAVDINFDSIRSVVIRDLPGTVDPASATAMQLEVDLVPTHLPKALEEVATGGDSDGAGGGRRGVRLVFTMGKEEARALLEPCLQLAREAVVAKSQDPAFHKFSQPLSQNPSAGRTATATLPTAPATANGGGPVPSATTRAAKSAVAAVAAAAAAGTTIARTVTLTRAVVSSALEAPVGAAGAGGGTGGLQLQQSGGAGAGRSRQARLAVADCFAGTFPVSRVPRLAALYAQCGYPRIVANVTAEAKERIAKSHGFKPGFQSGTQLHCLKAKNCLYLAGHAGKVGNKKTDALILSFLTRRLVDPRTGRRRCDSVLFTGGPPCNKHSQARADPPTEEEVASSMDVVKAWLGLVLAVMKAAAKLPAAESPLVFFIMENPAGTKDWSMDKCIERDDAAADLLKKLGAVLTVHNWSQYSSTHPNKATHIWSNLPLQPYQAPETIAQRPTVTIPEGGGQPHERYTVEGLPLPDRAMWPDAFVVEVYRAVVTECQKRWPNELGRKKPPAPAATAAGAPAAATLAEAAEVDSPGQWQDADGSAERKRRRVGD
ncbi:hypothetical protein HYH03_000309 [Edaphochlamys debaryana]|uniref:Uncharacterized protein n=1 Tax=Edaphochlamys debaryana TaxID=47281 RepID=A0A835YHC4_9CHLO|nr:hypothetical protein HYH03_000309 [Edaphochlamys debaryana]|eukprot:KAG2501809.1 hypothetical protein HYH03_000309 [Edaphochlamys debaryana]